MLWLGVIFVYVTFYFLGSEQRSHGSKPEVYQISIHLRSHLLKASARYTFCSALLNLNSSQPSPWAKKEPTPIALLHCMCLFLCRGFDGNRQGHGYDKFSAMCRCQRVCPETQAAAAVHTPHIGSFSYGYHIEQLQAMSPVMRHSNGSDTQRELGGM